MADLYTLAIAIFFVGGFFAALAVLGFMAIGKKDSSQGKAASTPDDPSVSIYL